MRKPTADWIVLVLGVWLVVSPWLLGYTDTGTAAATTYVIGIALLAFALVALFTSIRFPYQERFNYIVLALLLIASPWLLGFAWLNVALWNAVVIGILVVAMAAWALKETGSPDVPAR